jgi:hypothetical protein
MAHFAVVLGVERKLIRRVDMAVEVVDAVEIVRNVKPDTPKRECKSMCILL